MMRRTHSTTSSPIASFWVAALGACSLALSASVAGCGAGDLDSESEDDPIGEASLAATANQYAFGIGSANLADPDVHVEGTSIWLTGTPDGNPTTTIPFYQGISSFSMTYKGAFNPSSDTSYDYCHVWAPNLIKNPSGTYRLSFTADRISNGGQCPASWSDVSVYYVETDSIAKLYNGTVLTVNVYAPNGSNPVTVQSNSFSLQSMRIDPDLFDDGTSRWMTYTWFTGGGNAIGYFDRASSTSAGQHLVQMPAATERYNSLRYNDGQNEVRLPIYEASDIIKRGSYYYLFYSTGSFEQDYSIKVRRATTVPGLATAATRQLTFPLYNGGFTVSENPQVSG